MSVSGRTIALNAAAIGAGEVVCRLVSLILVMVVARTLGPAQMGIYAYCTSITSIFLIFLNFGFDPFVCREASRDPAYAPKLLSLVTAVKAALFVVLLPVAAAIALLSSDGKKSVLIVVMTVSVFFASHTATAYSFFRARLEAWFQSATGIITRTAAAGIGIVAVTSGRGITSLALIECAVAAVGCCAAYLFLRSRVHIQAGAAPVSEYRVLLARTWRFALFQLVQNVFNSSDLIMLPILAGNTAAGYYTAVVKLWGLVSFIPSVMAGTFLPVLSKQATVDIDTHARTMRRYVRLQAVIGSAFSAGFLLFSDTLPLLLYGDSFTAVRPTVMIMSPVIFSLFVNQALSIALITADREQRMLIMFSICAAANVGLNGVLIPLWAERGAAAATLACQGLLVVLQLRGLAPSLRSVVDVPKAIAGPMLAFACAAISGLWFIPRTAPSFTRPIVGMGVFALVALATGAIKPGHPGVLFRLVFRREGVV